MGKKIPAACQAEAPALVLGRLWHKMRAEPGAGLHREQPARTGAGKGQGERRATVADTAGYSLRTTTGVRDYRRNQDTVP
jgi:hypothetical protein